MKRKFYILGKTIVLLASTANFGMGQSVILNGSFEIVNGNSSVLDWNGSYSFGIPPLSAADGHKDVVLTDMSGAPASNPLWQSVSTVSGAMYALTFASRAPQFGTSEFVGREVGGSDPHAIGPWVVNVAINGTQIGSFENDSMTIWQYFTTDFVATSSTTTLGFYTDANAGWPMLDAVSMIAVPEPKDWSLFGGGLLIFGVWAWRQQHPIGTR
jgi:hypothetical protein